METFQSAASKPSFRNTVHFSEGNLNKLMGIMHEYKVPAGASIFWEGEPADKLHYIKKGIAKITKSNSHGKEFLLYVLQTGDFLGQLDPYYDSKQDFNAEAIKDCEIGVIQKKDLEILLSLNGDLAVEFMKWMGLMHRLTQTKFRDLVLYGKTGALCSTLIRLANTFGQDVDGHILITEKMTNKDLADYIGAARESVNRMLSELKKENVLEYTDGYIRIKNLDYLKEVCHCEHCPKEICRI